MSLPDDFFIHGLQTNALTPSASIAGHFDDIDTELQAIFFDDTNVDHLDADSSLAFFGDDGGYNTSFSGGDEDATDAFPRRESGSRLLPAEEVVDDSTKGCGVGQLLQFESTTHMFVLFEQDRPYWPNLSAGLHGGALYTALSGLNSEDRAMITCYRRNLFRVTARIELSRNADRVLLFNDYVTIDRFSALLTAVDSTEGGPVTLISMANKGTAAKAASAFGEEPSHSNAGHTIPVQVPLDWSKAVLADDGSSTRTFFLQWDKMQFKNATANNGRRRGLQQHYRLHVALLGHLDGQTRSIELARIQSNPIVVRGRSPKSFKASNDIALTSDPGARSGDVITETTTTTSGPPLSYNRSMPSSSPSGQTLQQASMVHVESQSFPRFFVGEAQNDANALPLAKKRRLTCLNSPDAEDLMVSTSLNDFQSTPKGFRESSAALPCTSGPAFSVGSNLTPPQSQVIARGTYEYIPLAPDECLAPVEAVYRPHGVHHLGPVISLLERAPGDKSKYYYLSAGNEKKSE